MERFSAKNLYIRMAVVHCNNFLVCDNVKKFSCNLKKKTKMREIVFLCSKYIAILFLTSHLLASQISLVVLEEYVGLSDSCTSF